MDPNLVAFIRSHVGSVWALELLLTLAREPERCWSVDELVRELRASNSLVTTNLLAFERGGLALQDDRGCYRYAPASAVLDRLCRNLDETYKVQPVAIIGLISQRGAGAVQSLADAFKFRRDPND